MDKDIIRKLKEQWGHGLCILEIGGREFIIRPLLFKEFDLISKLYNTEWDGADAEEAIVLKAVVYPEEFDINKIKAGAVTSLAEEILTISGFLPNDTYTKGVLETKRTEMREFRNMMKAFIIAAMPSYKDTDLDEFTYEQLAYKLALAEKIITIQQEAYGMQPTDLRLQITDDTEQPIQLSEEDVLEGKPPTVDPIAQKLQQALMG